MQLTDRMSLRVRKQWEAKGRLNEGQREAGRLGGWEAWERLGRGSGGQNELKSTILPFSLQSTLSPSNVLLVVYSGVFIVSGGLFEFHEDLVFLFFVMLLLGLYMSIIRRL